MVEKEKKIIGDLVPIFQQINTVESNMLYGDKEEVLLFFSFDIVNSTVYKTMNPNNWAEIIKNLLKASISIFINSSSDDYLMWESLGDEIVFTKKLTSISAISESLDEIYNKLQALNQSIRNAELCDTESAHILGIKATAWLANISGGSHTDNISVAYQINDNRKYLDYLGPDIDIGFRIAKYSMENQLLISFELAYLLLKKQQDDDVANKIRFVTRASLKGVWNNLPYPIFGYQYDVRGDISREEQEKNHVTEKELSYEERLVDEICSEMHLEQKIEKLIGIITRKSDTTPRRIIQQYKVRYKMVCYGVDTCDNSIYFMMVKTKKRPQWNLIEIDAYYDHYFVTDIQTYCREQLGVDVQVQLDTRYYGQVPILISSEEQENEKGSITKQMELVGRLSNDGYELKTSTYTDVVFINEKEIEQCSLEIRTRLSGYLEFIKNGRWN